MKDTQYTVRNVPKDLDARLRALSLRRKRSLNQVIIDQLTTSLRPSLTRQRSKKANHSFDEFFGSTIFDADFEKALAEQRQVDLRDWQ